MELSAHAYVGVGGGSAIPAVLAWLDSAGIKNDADLYVRTFAHFGVDEARELRERARLRAMETRRVFVIATAVITTEAQNALLKTFEEPLADALFVLLVPSPHILLPTLLSRMQMLDVPRTDAVADSPIDAKSFLKSDPAKRLDMLKPIFDADERDFGGIISFLGGCERELGMQFMRATGESHTAITRGLHAVYRAKQFITDKGALVKPLLEQVALLVPSI